MKKCSKCKKEKELKDFRKRGSGYRNDCKECEKVYQELIREKHPKRNKEWRTKNKEKYQETKRNYYKYNLEEQKKHKCRRKTQTLIKNGKIEIDLCSKCKEIAEIHHNDYDNPYDITWLCQEHHKELHIKINEAKSQ